MKLRSGLGGNIVRLSLTIMLFGILGISLAGCGGSDATPTVPAPAGGSGAAPTAAGQGSSGAAQEVKATLNEWSVALNVDQVSAGKVKFTVSNEGQFGHDLSVLDSTGAAIGKTPVFKKGDGPKDLEVDLKSGTYTVVCDVPGHTEKGMKTTLTVK